MARWKKILDEPQDEPDQSLEGDNSDYEPDGDETGNYKSDDEYQYD